MKPPPTPSLAAALQELEVCVDAELAAIEKLCSLGARAAEVRDRPLDVDAVLALLAVVGGKAELLRNDLGCLVDLVGRAAGVEVRT